MNIFYDGGHCGQGESALGNIYFVVVFACIGEGQFDLQIHLLMGCVLSSIWIQPL